MLHVLVLATVMAGPQSHFGDPSSQSEGFVFEGETEQGNNEPEPAKPPPSPAERIQALPDSKLAGVHRKFNHVDRSGDGLVTRQELLRAFGVYAKMKHKQENWHHGEVGNQFVSVNVALAELDKNRDGKLDFEEFAMPACNLHELEANSDSGNGASAKPGHVVWPWDEGDDTLLDSHEANALSLYLLLASHLLALAAVAILHVHMHMYRTARGISLKSQLIVVLSAVVQLGLLANYVVYVEEGGASEFELLMILIQIMGIVGYGTVVLLMKGKYKFTYTEKHDTCLVAGVLVACGVLALLSTFFHPFPPGCTSRAPCLPAVLHDAGRGQRGAPASHADFYWHYSEPSHRAFDIAPAFVTPGAHIIVLTRPL